MDTLGSQIRVLRKARHMTQVELGDGELSASLISQIESDKAQPAEGTLAFLCKRLGVEQDYFAQYLQINDQIQLYRKAKNLFETEQYEEAVKVYDALMGNESKELKMVAVYSEAAQCYLHLGDIERASTLYDLAASASLESNDPATAVHLYYQLGNIQRRRNFIAFARMYWVRAHEILKRHPSLVMPVAVKVHSNLGKAYYTLGQYEEAAQSYEIAYRQAESLSAHLDLAIVAYGLANVLVERKDFDKAETMTRTALSFYESLRHQRGINQCKVNFAAILRRRGELTEAVKLLTQYLREPQFYRDPIRHAKALSERALCFLRMGKLDEALKDAELFMFMADSDREVWTGLQVAAAEVYSAAGRYKEALELLEKASQTAHYTTIGVQRKLAKLYTVALLQCNQLERALGLAIEKDTAVLFAG